MVKKLPPLLRAKNQHGPGCASPRRGLLSFGAMEIGPAKVAANRVAALAMKRGKSVDFTGYWQRHVTD
jgi:hypothetical protein